ncbi:MAG: hypothetical protein KJ066_19280 [Acidobacteria bacterium]|nr:hypothetical protein [Acidobacteriota bacterium]
MSRIVLASALSTLALGAGLATASDPLPLPATWRAAPLVADGDDAEWSEPATSLGSVAVSVSVANDDQHLFLRLRTSDRTAAIQIVRAGFIVWFDPGGRDRKVFGIKYPVGTPLNEDDFPARGAGRPRVPPRDPDTSGDDDDRRPRRPPARGEGAQDEARPPAAPLVPADPSLVPPRLELLGRDKNAHRTLLLDHTPGIRVAVGRADDTLVYELVVPLSRTADAPYAVGARPGTTIGLGVETLKLELPKLESRAGRRPPMGGGGMGGPGGMGGRGRDGRPGGGARPEMPKPWTVWTKVALATAS